MLFLCVADTHGYLPNENLEVHQRPDALLLLGDLQHSIERVLNCFPGVPAFAVPGNHDRKELFDGLPVVDLHSKVVSFRGIRLGGLGGCLRYKSDPHSWLFWEHEYAAILKQMQRADLLISHCAPKGCWGEPLPGGDGLYHDAHEGSGALRDYITATQPGLVVHGHLHKRGVTIMGKTTVRSAYGVELVTFNHYS